ncbi:MAG: hypothetical protein ACI93R_001059 [Flavobacteriales bacterium]|jgi:hypothetical protein
MSAFTNPLIQDDPVDTMSYVRSVLCTLQDFYVAIDMPDKAQGKDTYCGLYWILKCADNALEFEIERCEKNRLASQVNAKG